MTAFFLLLSPAVTLSGGRIDYIRVYNLARYEQTFLDNFSIHESNDPRHFTKICSTIYRF